MDDGGIKNLKLVGSCLWLSGSVFATSCFITWLAAGTTASGPAVVLGTLAVAVLLSAAVVQTEIGPRERALAERRAEEA